MSSRGPSSFRSIPLLGQKDRLHYSLLAESDGRLSAARADTLPLEDAHAARAPRGVAQQTLLDGVAGRGGKTPPALIPGGTTPPALIPGDKTPPALIPGSKTPQAPTPGSETAAPTRRVRVMGARIAAVTEMDAVHAIIAAATARRGHWTITANLDHLRRYQRERIARELLDAADLVLADGIPLIWASRLAGAALPERVAGSNIVWSLSAAACQHETSVFLLGGDPGAAERAAKVLQERYPGLKIAGTLCPPMSFETDLRELELIQRELEAAAPQIVFVGLGFPKQDLLIRRLRGLLPGTSFIGVGISLSFVAGDVARAPNWTHKLCLEWLYRLLQEPRRLARRYVLMGVPFALRLLASAARERIRGGGADTTQWGLDLES
jgi:N-acetylglucosaminyldiphosphoundecaprenol N-acetyl-beta-D-mannosaminyltransferase